MTSPAEFAPWLESCSDFVRSHLQLPSVEEVGPQLSYDIAIIGGGIAGLSALGAAAASGLSCVLLEGAAALGMGASGRNAGIFCAGINMPITYTPKGSPAEALWNATQRKLLAILDEAKQPGSMLDVRRIGAVALATSATATKRLVQEVKARLAAGMSAEMVTGADIEKVTAGFLDVSSVHGAMLLPDEGAIQPLTLLATLANRARRDGAQLYGKASVERIEKGKDGFALHLAANKKVKCNGVISAVGPILNATGRIFALSFRYDPPSNCPVWWDANPYIYYDYRPGNGFLTVSGGRYGAAGTDSQDAKYHVKMAQAARKWVPALAGQEPSHAWAVDLNVAPDLLPEIKTIEENHLSVQGLGALGVLPGIVLGAQAAQQLSSRLGARAILSLDA